MASAPSIGLSARAEKVRRELAGAVALDDRAGTVSKPVMVGYAMHGRALPSVAHHEHESHAAGAAHRNY